MQIHAKHFSVFISKLQELNVGIVNARQSHVRSNKVVNWVVVNSYDGCLEVTLPLAWLINAYERILVVPRLSTSVLFVNHQSVYVGQGFLSDRISRKVHERTFEERIDLECAGMGRVTCRYLRLALATISSHQFFYDYHSLTGVYSKLLRHSLHPLLLVSVHLLVRFAELGLCSKALVPFPMSSLVPLDLVEYLIFPSWLARDQNPPTLKGTYRPGCFNISI